MAHRIRIALPCRGAVRTHPSCLASALTDRYIESNTLHIGATSSTQAFTMSLDFYEILDVAPDASDGDITDAYRRKVKEYHPDRNDHPRAHAQFKVLNKAHDVLRDPTERAAYDRLGHGEYVRKRIPGGLPLRDFNHPESAGESASGRTSRRAAEVTDSGRGTGSSASSTANAGAGNGTATGTGSRSRSGGSGRGRTGRSRTGRSRTGRRTRTGTSANSTGGTSAGHRRSSSSRRGSSNRFTSSRTGHGQGGATARRKEYSISLLWLYVVGAALPYVAALAGFGWQNAAGFSAFADAIVGGSIDPSTLAVERFGIDVVGTVVVTGLTQANPVAFGVVLGAVLLPAVFGVAVHRLRTRTIWNASPLYVLAAGAPLVGLGVNLGGIAILPLDLLLYVCLPAGAIVAFLYHRFIG